MRRLWIPGIATTLALAMGAGPAGAQDTPANKPLLPKAAANAAAKAAPAAKATALERDTGLKSVVPAAARSLPADHGNKAGCHGMKESDA